VKKIVASDWSMGKTVKIFFIFFAVFSPTNQKPSCSTFIHCFCLRPVSEADAEGLGTTISPPSPFVDFFF
jgi:hypothetical protein